MGKKNYGGMARQIIEACGGEKNIATVSHCMTRLRIVPVDRLKVDQEAVKKVPGVLSLIIKDQEHQIVIGQDVPSLYEEILKNGTFDAAGEVSDAAAVAEDMKKSNPLNAVMDFIGGTFSPAIPVLVAGGIIGAFLSLFTNLFGLSTDSGTYVVISAINGAAFYFLPVFIGYSAAQRLKSNGMLGALLACILLYSTINGAEGLSFLGIGIKTIDYGQSVFPILLGVAFMSVIYRFLQKKLPVALRTIFVPVLTMLVTVPVTLLILGPIGMVVGGWLSNAIYAIYNTVPALATMIVGALNAWLVFFGMNNALYPVVFALFAAVGSDPLICTGMAPANVAVGGACFAVFFLSKKAEVKSVASSAGVTALLGIIEPGVYGILFPLKRPLIGAMIGGGVGGLLAGILKMTQYAISTPGFVSIPAYIDPSGSPKNLIVSLIVMVVAVVVSFAATWMLGLKEEE